MKLTTLITAIIALSFTSAMALAQPHPGKGFRDRGQQVTPARHAEVERQRDGPRADRPDRPVHDRMSQEERRQLRRDIDQHGRELYRGRKGR